MGLLHNPVKRLIENEYVIEGPSRRILCKPDRSGGIGLGIAINEESRVFGSSKASGKIYCSGRLADAAFLVSNCDDSGQIFPLSEKLTKLLLGCKMFHVEHQVVVEMGLTIPSCSTWNVAHLWTCSARQTDLRLLRVQKTAVYSVTRKLP